ncbi:SMP-30/gluconolactonase/LRE family protein [Roseomonas sp. CECT 9278]|uniref:SMP-30/gluconolactonase/LRE family protein n=1 Tax=Roseomonas sp. CECT 9278 TaxID=2845823 RepID=UPI001E3C2D75|nr:SMP-30/gluconolactonase/LRE family protein [Roseomonas sp. CECT 9278]CAH0147531.1 Gluconolactonase [Roseomonas sp. CECT 9278]
MSAAEILDPRFAPLVIGHALLERLWTGGRWVEGPAYLAAGRYLVWSDIPNDRVMRWDETDGSVSVFRSPCNNENGHAVDRQGRLLSCEHRGRCVSRTEHDGSRTVLAAAIDGRRLNSPNDVATGPDGAVWFTDPTYGIDSDYEGDAAPSELGACHVYRIDPATGAAQAMVTDMLRPNGLAFSADGAWLYVSETGATHDPARMPEIRAYPLLPGAAGVGPGRRFATCDAGFFDGLRCDAAGNVWTSAGDGVRCHAPDGALIGRIPVPEMVSNLCFGGPKRNRLFITAHTSLYAIYVNTRGA